MKALKLLVVVFFALKLNAQTTYPSGVSGCIARWNFTNSGGTITSLPDVSGNGHNGATYNLAPAAGFRNIPNVAMHFDGSTSYADVPDNSQLTLPKFTIVALVKFDHFYSGTCQESQIISKGFPYALPGEYGLGVTDNFYDNSCSVYSPNYNQIDFQLDTISSLTILPGNYILPDTWYFLAVSYDSTNINTYQVIMDTTDFHSSISPLLTYSGHTHGQDSISMDISIGRHMNPSYPYWFAGYMDELVLFNKALTPAELETVYTYLWDGSGLSVQNLNQFSENDLNLFPNSNNGIFCINGSIQSGDIEIEIDNVLGQVVYKEHEAISGNKLNKNINLGDNVPDGLYLLKLNLNNQIIVKKFMVNR